jgi:ABC-type branched-subunit amino acid transport system substrate-binding protein
VGGKRKRRIATWVVAAVLLGSTGCGARLSDEELATASASGGAAAGGAGAATGTGTRTGGGTATGGSAAGGGGATGGAATAGDPSAGGTADPAAGGGDPAAAGGGECTPQPTDEIGVSDTEITIANISTISGPIAGFGQTGVNAVKAYVNYVNASGGVCGRQLRLLTGDDRLDAGTNRSETQRLAQEALGFVGAVTVVDDGGASILQGTNIPDVGLTIGSQRARLPNNFSPNPINPDQPGNAAIPIFQHFAGQGITSAAVVWPSQADARARGQGYVHDLQQAGIGTVDTFEVQVTETNYVNVAQQIENKGSQLVITTLEVTGMARLAQAFQQIGYRPQVPFYGAQAYGAKFLELAGEAAEGTTLAITHALFTDAVPPMQTFLEWYERTAPGSDPDFFAVMSWAAADMFVRAVRAAGGSPTRDAVLQQLQAMTEYTGDGFMAPRNPVAKAMGNCFVIIRAEGGNWVRVEPAGGGFINC